MLPGGTGVAAHLHVAAALLVAVVVGGGGGVAAAADAGRQAVTAAGLGAADCLAGAAWTAALSLGWELRGRSGFIILNNASEKKPTEVNCKFKACHYSLIKNIIRHMDGYMAIISAYNSIVCTKIMYKG